MGEKTEQEIQNEQNAKIREAAQACKVAEADVLIVETEIAGAEVAAFRVPTSQEWRRYRSEAMDSDTQVKAYASTPLVTTCCIYPPRPEFEKAIAAHPGLVETYSAELVQHAGVGRAKKVRKL